MNEQEEVGKLLEEQDPNMIKFIESSLQENCSSSKINSINMPVNTQIITFRSNSARLIQEEIQDNVSKSLPEKELINFCSKKKLINTVVLTRIMDIRWLILD